MKWNIDNLFEYNKIRPKKHFRKCGVCKKESKVFKIKELKNTKIKGKTFISLCPKCYEEHKLEEMLSIPSYMINYSLLLEIEHKKQLGFENKKEEDYYRKLKKCITNDSYFRYLKRVKNRNKLYIKKNK